MGEPHPLERDEFDADVPWWPHRPARRGAPSDPVTEETIVATALELLSDETPEGLSVRQVAASLGVSRATVYWWIGSRDRLLSLVVDAVHGQIAVPAAGDRQPWTDRLRELARAIYDVYAAYPGVAPILDEGVLAGPQTLRVLDRSMSILLDAGFEPASAVRAWATVQNVITGCLADARRSRSTNDDRWTGGQGLSALPETVFPALAVTASQMNRRPMNDFEFALSTVLDGLQVRLSALR